MLMIAILNKLKYEAETLHNMISVVELAERLRTATKTAFSIC
jgi:DNA-binding Lrp family transcriptional regulator